MSRGLYLTDEKTKILGHYGRLTWVRRSQTTAPSQDPAVGLCRIIGGCYGGGMLRMSEVPLYAFSPGGSLGRVGVFLLAK